MIILKEEGFKDIEVLHNVKKLDFQEMNIK